MIKKRILVLVTLATLLLQVVFIQTTQGNISSNNYLSQNNTSEIDPVINFITPDAPPGAEDLISDVLYNGDFEDDETDGSPSGYTTSGTGYSKVNFTYQDEVHTDLYGGHFLSRGTSQYSAQSYGSRNVGTTTDCALPEDITMDFWYNVKADPDYTIGSEMRTSLTFQTNLGQYYLYYILSSDSFGYSNITNLGVYDIRTTASDTWLHTTRNVTDDFIKAMGTLPNLSLSYLIYFEFICTSPRGATGDTVFLIDDVSVTNDSYNFFSDNGDFEDGDGSSWYKTENSPTSAMLTQDDQTQGTSALNLTASSYSASVYNNPYVRKDLDFFSGTVPKGYVAYQPGDIEISFDWKYSDMENGAGIQNGYFYVYAKNGTDTTYIYYFFGTQNNILYFTNDTVGTSTNYYFAAPNFGTQDTWHHFSVDVYTMFSELNLMNFVIQDSYFRVTAGSAADLTVQLLVDDYQFVTYPVGDSGFEYDIGYVSYDPIRLWHTYNPVDYVNISTDAHLGNFAANISSYNGIGSRYLYREMYMPITDYTYTDFWWKINKLTPAGGDANSYIRLEIDDSDYIYYVTGSNNDNFVNSSDTVYYFVNNCNQTGVWNNIIRNLNNDINGYFGGSNWIVTRIDLATYATGTAEIVSIYDDLNFITDVAGPILSNLVQTPDPVGYGEAVTLSIDVEEFDLSRIELHYQIDYGLWVDVPMTLIGGHYEAIIPAQDFGTVVYYSIEAEDKSLHITDSGAPFSYVVADSVFPTLDVEAPPFFATLTGDVIFNITSEDVGSGINYFKIRINGVEVYDDSIVPPSFTWITTDYPDGDYVIVFDVADLAGNGVEGDYTYTIDNIADTPTNVGALFGGLVSFGLVAIASSTMIYYSERRKKYLKRR